MSVADFSARNGRFLPLRNNRRFDNRSRSTRSSRFPFSTTGNRENPKILKIGPNLTICQLNIEGISKDKCDYLSKVAFNIHADVLVLQETHTASEADLHLRGEISGYTLAGSLNNAVYGLATYVKSNISDYQFVDKNEANNVYRITIKVAGVYITNIYKPPNEQWPVNLPATYNHPAMYIGDFNSHNNLWGYADNDQNGIALASWMEINNLHLVFDAKDRKSFYSARWKKDYNPDLCFVTMDNDTPLPTSREVLSAFPHSQHRPIIIKVGIEIKPSQSLEKPRWNFQKARWTDFAKQVDSDLRWIPATSSNYDRFVGVIKSAAKKHIPRGFRKYYVPGWSTETDNLYNSFLTNPTTENAAAILKSLNEARKQKWNILMENLNFTHSSRSGWDLLKKLSATTLPSTHSTPEINPNKIASRLLNVSNSVKISRTEKKEMKRSIKKQRKTSKISEDLSRQFTIDELHSALKSTKSRKAAGFDGIYPEFLKHLGKFALKWLVIFFNDIFKSATLPPAFKKTKVIAILKKGKPSNEASSYRPISLLSVCYKVLERMIYQRICPIIEKVLPPEQAGFRPQRSCCDQVLALTTHIENGFQRRLKTGIVLLDLTAAYDTVWKDGLIHKLYKTLECNQTVRLIESMLSNRKFRVFLGDQSSKFKILNNGLPQGAVLSPILFNLYTNDLPTTSSRKFIYADDIALAYQHKEFTELEQHLTSDINVMYDHFKKWRLCINPSKTEVSCFHLCNSQKDRTLDILINGVRIKHNYNPVYLGVTLDCSLTYKNHLEKLRQKLKTRVNILSKLAGSTWGAHASTLRISTLALMFSSAEYCSPVWLNSAHTQKIDVQLNTAMRIITGTIKSTPSDWLPVLSNISPPPLRRKRALKKLWMKYKACQQEFPICAELISPENRLKSRKAFWTEIPNIENFEINDEWRRQWSNLEVFNKNLISDPTIAVPGMDQPRWVWTKINRIRTGHARCRSMLFKWHAVEHPICQCEEAEETVEHIVQECRITKFEGDFREIHLLSQNVVPWLTTIKNL